MAEDIFEEAHSAVAIGIAERFTVQPHSMAWEQRCDELATAAIEAMQLFISMRSTRELWENPAISAKPTD